MINMQDNSTLGIPTPPSGSSSPGSGPAAWLARSLAAQASPRQSPLPLRSSPRAAASPLFNFNQRGSNEMKSESNSSSNQSQPNLKFLSRRKKMNNDGISIDGTEMDMNASVMSAYTNISSNPVANAKTLATASEKLHKLSIEMHKMKEERDQLLQDKNIWLKKIKDDNMRLTLMLQDIRSVKTRVLSKIEKFGMGEDGEDTHKSMIIDDESDMDSKRKQRLREVDLNKKLEFEPRYRSSTQSSTDTNHPIASTSSSNVPDLKQLAPDDILKLLPTINLDTVTGRSIHEQWQDDFESLIKPDDSIREIVWDMLLSHITIFVRGHPLSQGLDPMIIREIVQEISMQVRSLVGKTVCGLIRSGAIILPIIDDIAHHKPNFEGRESSTRSEVVAIIMKLLHSSAVHSEIAGEVTMTLTYLYALDPRPLPLTNEDMKLNLPTKPVVEVIQVPSVKPVLLEPKQFQRPPSPSISTSNKPKRTLVIDALSSSYDKNEHENEAENDGSSTSASATTSSLQPEVETLQSLQPPRTLPPTPSPRYMQAIIPKSRSSTPTAASIPPPSTSSTSNNRSIGSRTASFQDSRSSSSASASSTPRSQTIGSSSNRSRVLNIDDDGIRSNSNNDDPQTLRQMPVASPKTVPRYMQPKNTTARSNK